MTDALQITGLSKSFCDFTLENISFSIPEGAVMGLIGPNGSGKTTTIKLILNLMRKQSGSVTVLGMDHLKDEQAFKEQTGVVFDSHFFVDDWKMSDVEKAVGMFYKTWDSNLYYRYLEQFQIGRTKRVRELSKGMQMKLMLACALSHRARLLILDEPTSGLDPVSRDELLDILLEYTQDKSHTVLFSTHITPDLSKIADYITFINKGRLLYTGKTKRFTEMYYIISGRTLKLSPWLQKNAQSIRRYHDCFEALVLKEQAELPPGNELTGCQLRAATIDDIIVFTNKGGIDHE